MRPFPSASYDAWKQTEPDSGERMEGCADCFEPAELRSDCDDVPRCRACDREEERRIERLRGGEPDREHISAMRAEHFGEGRDEVTRHDAYEAACDMARKERQEEGNR
jgi:hypothetical protein